MNNRKLCDILYHTEVHFAILAAVRWYVAANNLRFFYCYALLHVAKALLLILWIKRPGPARGSGVRTSAPFVIGDPLLLLCALYSLQSMESFVVHDTQHADPCPHLMPAPPRRGLQLHLQLRSHAHLTFPEAPTCLRDNIALRWHATLLDS